MSLSMWKTSDKYNLATFRIAPRQEACPVSRRKSLFHKAYKHEKNPAFTPIPGIAIRCASTKAALCKGLWFLRRENRQGAYLRCGGVGPVPPAWETGRYDCFRFRYTQNQAVPAPVSARRAGRSPTGGSRHWPGIGRAAGLERGSSASSSSRKGSSWAELQPG